MTSQKTILVAPLHWGLGHATRCIPIIKGLLFHNYNVIIASDGGALLLLKKEFPELESIELPPYNITYPKNGVNFKWKILVKLPHIQKTISEEKNVIKKLVAEGRIHGIISDNRLGVRNKKIPSIFITHQLKVLSGTTTKFTSFMHQKVIKKFTECWVPDVDDVINLSGKLGHLQNPKFPIKYIGPLSRMQAKKMDSKYDILILLSGPEPQRTMLEEKLIGTLFGSRKKIILVQGVLEEKQTKTVKGNITIINFLLSNDLEQTINESKLVISRSGYTTIMDLAAMGKKAFFIPTPGQYEQEYLAKKLKEQGIAPSCKQHKFSEKKLKKIIAYKGLGELSKRQDFKKLFRLFESE
ncbi:glycosyltransferase [Patiriisocius hiemis]|uniref:Glycosyltransferase n=1 Tax=Patiriisocius hiemis TaxID=3075604 RepID=A0ABU2YFD5_9FLAO|nr:glycosyltransferase [Constantimarinum sp. W242]MDT0556379.1 glycosyltransferase [Constantimarinum sp. W242]